MYVKNKLNPTLKPPVKDSVQQSKRKGSTLICYSRKRAEAEGRKGSFPCSKAMSSHHPTDPVELRRINFQTPGKADTPIHASFTLTPQSIRSVFNSNHGIVSLFSLPCVSVPRLSSFVKLVGLSLPQIVSPLILPFPSSC